MHTDAPTVWVTRPAGEAAASLGQRLQQQGWQVHQEALLLIAPISDASAIARYKAQLQQLHQQQGAVFISANAVTAFARMATPQQIEALRQLQLYAVGPATAARLAALGLAAAIPDRQMTSEGLLQLPALQQPPERMLIFRGMGGRSYLQQQLAQRGASVEYVELYQRLPPNALTEQLQTRLAAGGIQAITVGSIETFANLQTLWPQLPPDMILVVPGQRVQAAVAAAGFKRVFCATGASDDDMVETLHTIKQKNRGGTAVGG